MTFKEWQACISDFFGGLVVIWSMILISAQTPSWPHVMIIVAGLSTIVGKRVMDNFSPIGIGGGNGNGKNGSEDNNSDPVSTPMS